jgi:hypothetical protein
MARAKIRHQHLHADQQHPKREDQRDPFPVRDYDQEHQSASVANNRHQRDPRHFHGAVGHYRTGAASYGFQAGVKKFGYALFFHDRLGTDLPRQKRGWAIGTGPSIVVLDKGAARSLTTTNLRSDVYAFVFSQQGLMGGIGLEGSKITKINPSE